jgi:hypothetical protein
MMGKSPDTYAATWSQIQLASTVMAPVWGRMVSAASVSWEYYCIADEYMCIKNLFLSNFINVQFCLDIFAT